MAAREQRSWSRWVDWIGALFGVLVIGAVVALVLFLLLRLALTPLTFCGADDFIPCPEAPAPR